MNYTILIYSIISFFLLFLISKVSYWFNLVDFPNKRKIHSKATVYTGGIALSLTLVFSNLIFDINLNYLNLILSISFLISVVGFIDDKFNLNAGGKLSLQVIPIFYLIVFENLFLNNLGEYGYFKIELGTFAIPFTLMSVLFLINSFNYFDGLDGTLSFTTFSVLAILYFLYPDKNFQFFLIIILIPLSLFLLFNFSHFSLPKMFLGDSGSLMIGFVIAFILIYIAKLNIIHPILLAWSVVIFVYEFLSVNIIRLKNKVNPIKPGLDHLHHILLKKTKSIFFTNLYIFLGNINLFIIGYLTFKFYNSLTSLILFILFFNIYIVIRYKISKKIL